MNVSKKIQYVGVNDYNLDLFEGQYAVPNGMSYNSYVILDEKIAVMDSVDGNFSAEWLKNVDGVLQGRTPDYLVVQHMEPDHSGSIAAFVKAYPSVKIVSSSKAFQMMKNYFGSAYEEQQIVVGEGSVLELGTHKLRFFAAPMVHWPEVVVSYEENTKTLFSADAFGKFGAIGTDEDWACEARRYYIGIVGKYGVQVRGLLKKLSDLEIETICPLHGPVLKENIAEYVRLYSVWSGYEVETDGIVIAYTSVYGNTKKAVERLAELLKERGIKKVVLNDLARSDMAEAVEDAFRYGTIVLATTTYNGGIFPFMREFLHELAEHNYQNRRVALIENGSWAPMAARGMKTLLEPCKNLRFAETEVKILSALTKESEGQLVALANELCKEV